MVDIANPLIDIDPDQNYFNSIYPDFFENNSKYFRVDEIHSKILLKNTSHTIFNYNVRSFRSNSDCFLSLFPENRLPQVFTFTETWFTKNYVDSILGYTSYHTVRNDSRSGGVSVFILDSINSQQLLDLSICNSTIESCVVEIYLPSFSYVLISIYRPHSDSIVNFIDALQNILDNEKLRNKFCVVLGDFNINLLLNNHEIRLFLDFMKSHYFLNYISKPTRFGNISPLKK